MFKTIENQIIKRATALVILFIILSSLSINAQMAKWETTSSGTINDIAFKFENLSQDVSFYEWDFSTSNYYTISQSKNERCISYLKSENWHINFNKEVKNLYLYIGAWRPGVYKFSSKFEIVSKSSNIKKYGNYLVINEEQADFGHGIIVFFEPICCLYLESSKDHDSEQVMTFGVFKIPKYFCGNVHNSKEKDKSKEELKKECLKKAKAYPIYKEEY